MADAVSQIAALPWWAQILPGLNVVALFMGLRRLSRLEFMVETLWKQSGLDAPRRSSDPPYDYHPLRGKRS